MPPPVARESHLTAVTALRQLVATSKSSVEPKDALAVATQAQESIVEIVERMVTSLGSLEDTSEILETSAARGATINPQPTVGQQVHWKSEGPRLRHAHI